MIYPIYLAQIPQPPESVCFIQLPTGRTQDLSYLCGESPKPVRSPEFVANPVVDPPVYLPPNAVNSRVNAEPATKPEPEEEEE
jgi:hypothetical protein